MELLPHAGERPWAVGVVWELRRHIELGRVLSDLNLELLRTWTPKS